MLTDHKENINNISYVNITDTDQKENIMKIADHSEEIIATCSGGSG